MKDIISVLKILKMSFELKKRSALNYSLDEFSYHGIILQVHWTVESETLDY